MTNGQAPPDPAIALGDLLALIFEAKRVARRGLLSNPSLTEERALNEQLIDLELRRVAVKAQLDALLAGQPVVGPPSAGQVAEISRLAGEVEHLTAAATSASAAVVFGSKVLTVAGDVVKGGRPVG
jgi:hypothetical protein